MNETNLQNWLDGAGFAGLFLGACIGLFVGTWIVGRCWKWAMREASQWKDTQSKGSADGKSSAGQGSDDEV